MFSFALPSFVAAALVASLTQTLVSAQATADQLNSVQTQFDALSLSAPYPQGFGVPLKSQAILQVAYPSGVVQLGHPYNAADVSTQPSISIVPSNQTAFKGPNTFTLMLADANALGNPDPQGNYRHYLENGASFGDPTGNGSMVLNPGSGTVVTSYVGPGPLLNSGQHRYAWMLFAQPSGFQAPSNLSSAGVSAGHWYVNSYVANSNLGDLVAASFFTIQNGTKTFSNSTNNVTSSNTTPTTFRTNGTAAVGAKSPASAPLWMGLGNLYSVVVGLCLAIGGYSLI